MAKHAETIWPPIATPYTDEFGEIDPEVYAAAGRLWGQGEKYARSRLGDASMGLRLMLNAAALVSRKYAAPDTYIANLAAYLFQTYRHLILAELRKRNDHRQLETERQSELENLTVSLTEDLDHKILIEQIMRRMDDWMREVFELLILGHSFVEIGKFRDKDAHALRTKFNKHLKHLTKQIQSDNDES